MKYRQQLYLDDAQEMKNLGLFREDRLNPGENGDEEVSEVFGCIGNDMT